MDRLKQPPGTSAYKLEITASGRQIWGLLEQIEHVRIRSESCSLLDEVCRAVEAKLRLFEITFEIDGATYQRKSGQMMLVYIVYLKQDQVELPERIFGDFCTLRTCRQSNQTQFDNNYPDDLSSGC